MTDLSVVHEVAGHNKINVIKRCTAAETLCNLTVVNGMCTLTACGLAVDYLVTCRSTRWGSSAAAAGSIKYCMHYRRYTAARGKKWGNCTVGPTARKWGSGPPQDRRHWLHGRLKVPGRPHSQTTRAANAARSAESLHTDRESLEKDLSLWFWLAV